MKKRSAIFLAFILVATLSHVPVHAAEGELLHVFLDGDYVPAPTSTGPALGYYFADSYRHMSFRWNDFSQEYNCNLCVQMWTGLERSGYASLEEALAARPQYLDERSVCIFYAAQEDLVYIHVGQEVIPGCDTTAVEAALHGEAPDAYYKAVNTFNALCAAAGEVPGHYLTEIGASGLGMELYDDLSAATAPLHQAFSGHVYVDLYPTGSAEDGTVLRRAKELDYDAIYDKWEHKMDYYYQDTIWITYHTDTGDALLDIGAQVRPKLSKGEIEAIQAAFLPVSDPHDLSGFQAGVDALAEALQAERSGPRPAAMAVLAAGGLGVLLLAVLLVRKNTKKAA